jgi:minor extracellular protease Epr
MKCRHLISLSLAGSIALPLLVDAQVPVGAPDVTQRIDAVIERQVERAQRQAEQRVPQVLDQAQERINNRAQEQVAEQARQKAADQIQERTAEQAQDRAASQVQDRAASQVQDRATGQLPDVAASQAQDRAGQLSQSAPGQSLRDTIARDPATSPRPEAVAPPDRFAQSAEPANQAFVEIMIEPNIRVLEREWVMLLTASQRDLLALDSSELMRYHVQTSPFEALDSYLLRFRVPPALDSIELIQQMVPESMRDLLDRNHIYSTQTGRTERSDELPLPMAAVCLDPVSIGIIDTVVDDKHAAFAARPGRAAGLVSRHFITEDIEAPTGHGTAIASILVGQGPDFNPLMPNGSLYSASVVYSQAENHQGVTVIHLLEALDWLISQDVSVINMSLSGPANRLLEQGVKAAFAKGKVIVAAAGNQGPHAPVAYPAGYESVIAVTAVARDRSIYRWANQGEHIDFAAIGVSVPSAGGPQSGHESGTSMAAPVVSAFMACALNASGQDRQKALLMLKNRAVDLGQPGHDPIFGYGLLHP